MSNNKIADKIGDKAADKTKEFTPNEFESGRVEIRAFQPKSFKSGAAVDYQTVKTRFGSFAQTDRDSSSTFSMYPESKKLLGVETEERTFLEGLVSKEVEERIESIRQEAYQKGLEEGKLKGTEDAAREFKETTQPIYDQFVNMLKEFDGLKEAMSKANEKILIQLVFHIGKNILLRELKTDTEYVKRLAFQLIDRVGAKESVRIKMNHQDYANVDRFKELLKEQFPDLKNIQIEPTEELPLGGCKVETDLCRINAGVELQLNAIEASLGGT